MLKFGEDYMCFAYFKMNKFERNPEKYIKEKCTFLFSRGYSLKTFQKNAEYCFDFHIRNSGNIDINHIYFFMKMTMFTAHFQILILQKQILKH